MHVVFKLAHALWPVKGGFGVSSRVLPPVTARSRIQVVVSSHCTNEYKVSLTLFSGSRIERELSALGTHLCRVARGHWLVAVFSYCMPSKMCLYLLPLKFEAMVHLGITAMPYILAEMKNVRTPNKVA